MKRILILVTLGLFLCCIASAFQGGGGESSRKKVVTKKKNSGTKSANPSPIKPTVSPGPARTPAPAITKAPAADRERQYEAIRVAERSRVEQGIAGEWSDETARLTITRDGNKFNAEYPSTKGRQVLSVELLADNQLRLVNVKQYGKIVNPFEYYQGDFDQEAWIELGGDGNFLTVRFSQAKDGRSLVMKRIAGSLASRVPEANAVIWASVSAGESYACAVTKTGAPYCWGHGLGSPDLVAVIGDLNIAMVSAGYDSTCWVTTNGKAYCSGGNDSGQLGTGKSPTVDSSGSHREVPTAVAGGLRFSVVSVGKEHACGLTTSGAAYCWGSNFHQQLGNSAVEASRVPVAVAGGLRFATLSAGAAHTCAVTPDSKAYCWGNGVSGEFGDGRSGVSSGAVSSVPVAVAGGLSFASVTASKTQNFTCGLTTSGAAYCWGDNENLQLGNGNTRSSSVPVAVAGGLSFTTLSAGALHVCGVTTSGAAYCWGQGGWGQLGTGRTKDALTPVPVAGTLKFASISSGDLFTCGVTTNGEVYCWGSDSYGQLGVATTADRNLVPVAVQIPADEDGFKAFFREFCSAVRKRDRATLELMMSPTIEFPVEIGSPSMAFDYLGYDNGKGWKHLEESVTEGTSPYKDSSPKSVIRVTNDVRSLFGPGSVFFGRGTDGKWRWIRYLGSPD
jgi:alpha-tubulin suppressor-like RCC1 family protein